MTKIGKKIPVDLALREPYWLSERRLLGSRCMMKWEFSKVLKNLSNS